MINDTQLRRWSGDFGKDYTLRNLERNFHPDNIDVMRALFHDAFKATKGDVQRTLEIGCNTGHNFLAMDPFGPIEMVGVDPQAGALRIAKERGVSATLLIGSVFNIPFFSGYFDFVMTNGVLMHVSPEDLPNALSEIKRVSRKYFFTMDYFDEIETVVTGYHGQDDMLWRRDIRVPVAQVMPTARVLWEKKVSRDERTCKFTWAFLFEI